ncbi:hypothetical protein [Lichenifustis flavocetrariae]|uniref:Uncharacterized protein n=1 Tax=Lichenifustis flavocetrariae TaxID=2949735 RepID=A0AA42CLH1_9HYPH|nr:hypothetical protein [Lichenifustis flavocetrariae]MCW6511583.1 hypothetical protein [Lichenifustis flavocetrariae]
MEKSTVLAMLTLFTLLSGMAVAAYQLWMVKDAKNVGEEGSASKERMTNQNT